QAQCTSIFNTPFFVNAIQNGVNNEKSGAPYPYTEAAYLLLNSLPLATLKDKYRQYNSDGSISNLSYILPSFKKFGAVHELPYAWILKYGSIWHRYKNYVNNKIDILDDVWKDFDYAKSYDPVSGNSYTNYTILDYSGNPKQISLQRVELLGAFPNFTQRTDIFNTGFYPQVVNSVEYYLNGKDLFTGYTANDFSNAYK
ncbi:MAG: hypothetical protein ACK56F_26745, partial [bacterium]